MNDISQKNPNPENSVNVHSFLHGPGNPHHTRCKFWEIVMLNPAFRLAVVVVAFWFTLTTLGTKPKTSYAQAPPITSSGLNTQVSDAIDAGGGITQYNITDGTRIGTNVFHSFGDFGVPDSTIANFQNEPGNPATSNILGRVTGANPSNIFGTVQTEGFDNANLFLLNPNGIVFGPNASLNVGGAAHFTTADYLETWDGDPGNPAGIFHADLGKASDLTSAPVSAFGFLTENPASIVVNGSDLSVDPGQTLSLVGGNITIGSSLTAPGGKIVLASTSSAGEFLNPSFNEAPNSEQESFTSRGTITLNPGTTLDVSNDAAGTVVIRGGQFMMTDSTISADTAGGDGASTAIDIQVTGDIEITDTLGQTALSAQATGFGNAGTVKLSSVNFDATSTSVTPFALIDTHTTGFGSAGHVDITTTGNLTARGDPVNTMFFIDSGTKGFNGGQGGDFSIMGGNVSFADIFINTGDFLARLIDFDFFSFGSGGNGTIIADSLEMTRSVIATDGFNAQAGNLTLNVTDLHVRDFSLLQLSQFMGGGMLTINADTFYMDNSQVQVDTVLGLGDGIPWTAVDIDARMVDLKNGSTMASETFGNGAAGDIQANITEQFTLSDDPTTDGAMLRPSGLFTNNFDFGLGDLGPTGTITVTSPVVDISGGARIDNTTSTSGPGGNVIITATTGLSLSGQREIPILEDEAFGLGSSLPSGIFSRTVGDAFCSGPCGNAGNVFLTTGSFNVTEGAAVNSGTINDGIGGNITANASGDISISGTQVDGTPGGIFSRTTGGDPSAVGGEISLTTAQTFSLSNEAEVSAESSGAGDSGNIIVSGQTGNFTGGGQLNSSSSGAGQGGIVTVTTTGNTFFASGPGSGIFSQASGAGSGGAINIQTTSAQLSNGASLSASSTGTGDSGSVTLAATSGIQSSNANISTSAAQGTGGDITLTAGKDVNLTNNTTVSAESSGLGDAGDIFIESGNNLLVDNSSITTNAAQADGGNIKLTAPNIIRVNNSIISSAVNGGPDTTGGNIDIDPLFILVQNSKILAIANQGQGGNITLTADVGIFIDTLSTLDASSQGGPGLNGIIDIQAPTKVLSGTVAALPEDIVQVASLFAERCAAQKGGQFSSFVQGGRDGVPPQPGGFLPSPPMLNHIPSGGSVTGFSDHSPDTPVRQAQYDPTPYLTKLLGSTDWAITENPYQGCAA
jgi:filamentous hemagglutinin family protein